MSSFRNRLLALMLGLIVATQSVTLFAVLARVGDDVEARAGENLIAGASYASQFLQVRSGQLAAAVAVLAQDYGFREAVASADSATMGSALANHMRRVNADVGLIADIDGVVQVLQAGSRRESSLTLKQLQVQANGGGPQAFNAVVGDQAFQFLLVPVRAPRTIGWVALGFALNDELAGELKHLLAADVSLLALDAGDAVLAASSLSEGQRRELQQSARQLPQGGSAQRWRTGEGGGWLVCVAPLPGNGDRLYLVLQRTMTSVQAPYREVRDVMLAVGGTALFLAVAFGVWLARTMTRPIAELEEAAGRIAQGDYSANVMAKGGRELSRLAASFNSMQRGIADRETQIRHRAYHDELTGLPNRFGAEQALEEMLRQYGSNALIGCVMISAHSVREVNASLGYRVGDEAVASLAKRLQDTCGRNDIVARVGAYRFLIVVRQCSLEQARLLAIRLQATVRAELAVDGAMLSLNAAFGVCASPDHGYEASLLLRRAEIALQGALDGDRPVVVYESGRDQGYHRRVQLTAELHKALKNNDLRLVFQPKVAIADRRVRSVEALARWRHAELGEIAPAEFVTLAQQTGLIRQLTRTVLRKAIRQLGQWRKMDVEIEVAVNVSAQDLMDVTFADEVLAELRQNGVPPTLLVLEITESAAMREPVTTAQHMQLLRVAGVRFAIDDFGTGYSSLSHLSRLPVDELKIDRSFVSRSHESRDDRIIVSSTIELGHAIGLRVVAEGVETHEVWTLLRQLGCDYAQGYLISKPLEPSQMVDFVRRANEVLTDSSPTLAQLRALNIREG
ncbi:MAG: EAL domain-containing protein [Steroidobacteraceae bacterium]